MNKTIIVLLLFALASSQALGESCDLQFTSYNQTAWGTSPSGNNSASYRNAHFAGAFPNGILIGDVDGNWLNFTTPRAVQLFLPSKGTPAPLDATATNPTSSAAGILAGETLSLALNVGFDDADEAFSASARKFADLQVSNGACQGMTVSEVLAQANLFLAGHPARLNGSELQACALAINSYAQQRGTLTCANSTNQDPQAAIPPANTTPANQTPSTVSPDQSGTSISIAKWYPKGTHYVFFCNTASLARNYSWYFGDGEKLLQIRNDNVYHIYRKPGNYTVACEANGNIEQKASLQLHVQ